MSHYVLFCAFSFVHGVSFLECDVVIGLGHLMQIGISQRLFLLHLHLIQPNLRPLPLLPSLQSSKTEDRHLSEATVTKKNQPFFDTDLMPIVIA